MRYTVGVICPIKGLQRWDKCMACNLKYEFRCYPPPLLAYLYKLRQDELKEKFDYSVTELLDCPRRIHFARVMGEFINPEKIYLAWKGIISHEVMEKWTPLTPETLIEKRFFIKYKDKYIITFQPDRIDKDILYDFKFVHEIPMFRKPYRYHAQQVNLYKFLLNNYTPITINQAKLIYMTYKAMEVIDVELLEDRLLEIQIDKKLRLMDEKYAVAFDPNENWRCRNCYFYTICFTKLSQEGYSLELL